MDIVVFIGSQPLPHYYTTNTKEKYMSFAFATCDRRNALGFLQKLYPSYRVEDTDDSVKALLDIIEADELRICDPSFHGGQIIEGKNFGAETAERATAALKAAGLPFGRAA
jgi:hypothetical protein